MNFIKRIFHKFKYALEGLKYALSKDKSVRIQSVIAGLVIALSFILKLDKYDLIVVLVLCALVIALEMLNSSLELLSDFVCEGKYSEEIKRVKDVGAGAVLVISLFASIIGFMIFYSYIF